MQAYAAGRWSRPMTWSIIAKDPETGAFGVAVTTKFFAVGALCPHGGARIGALATQALVNPLYGTDGIRFLAEGRSAEEIVSILIAADPGQGIPPASCDRPGRPHRGPYGPRLHRLVRAPHG